MRFCSRAVGNIPYSGLIHPSAIGLPEIGVGPLTIGGRFVSWKRLVALLATALPIASPAFGQPAAQPDQTLALPAAQPAPVPPSLGPSMTGPLQLNSNPLHVDGGPLGPIYVSGVISGLGLAQSNHFPGDRATHLDLSNGMAVIQNSEGIFQFYAQVGGYSLPSMGTAYIKASKLTRKSFGLVPVAFLKIAPTSDFNIEVGKLFTLQGAENAFTYQNFNIERGLLWNQTATINRGVQANYAHGPLSSSLSVNDGFYSKKYNWLSGTIGDALSAKDGISFGAAANLGHTNKSNFTTPITLNNGQLYFLSWTHTDGPWTIQPYVQLGHVKSDADLGIAHSASTYGAALLGKYSFSKEVALAGRAEWIKSSGTLSNGAPSLLYGPGSGALSLTLTPTFQKGVFFGRLEGSYLHVYKTAPGFALGGDFNKKSQVRGLIEAGIIF